jgi:hypothetical protein
MTALREEVLDAIKARLEGQLPAVPVERSRRAPVDPQEEELPRLVLTSDEIANDTRAEPGANHLTMSFQVSGFAAGDDDAAADAALSELQAAVGEALDGWASSIINMDAPEFQSGEFRLFDSEDESAKPAGQFVSRFTVLVISPTGKFTT